MEKFPIDLMAQILTLGLALSSNDALDFDARVAEALQRTHQRMMTEHFTWRAQAGHSRGLLGQTRGCVCLQQAGGEITTGAEYRAFDRHVVAGGKTNVDG